MIHEDRNVVRATIGQLIFELPPTIWRIIRKIENAEAALPPSKIYIYLFLIIVR
jgi:hypothetical protein